VATLNVAEMDILSGGEHPLPGQSSRSGVIGLEAAVG